MQKVRIKERNFSVIPEPHPHILVPTQKELHGWWPGKRECTGERLLINPYNGCSVGCFFCYTRAFPGYFELFHKKDIVVVAERFPETIAGQLDSVSVTACGYLSPVSDPFQKLNEKYRYSEQIIEIFIERNIPIEFITKCRIPSGVLEVMQRQRHSFGQISILTLDENLRKVLAPCVAETSTLLENIRRMRENGIFAVARIDPILPFINDRREDLRKLVKTCVECGASHIITSVLDIPVKIRDFVLEQISKSFGKELKFRYLRLYRERIGGYLHADIDYRKELFSFLKSTAQQSKVTFALCMEYEVKDGMLVGLNRYFMTSVNCEGMNVPIYIRRNKKFTPASSCSGNCLNCEEAFCGIPDLAMGRAGSKKDWKLKDYRRWSKYLRHRRLL
ncbi:MAG TPA: hypothetical protein EYP78_03940 [Candidatus Omnitrophica bacterium]|nr:hypothetical protein [Candidatus Omnitrophota bacterium]